MRNTHPDDGFLAEALDLEDYLLTSARELVRCSANLPDAVGVGLPINYQCPDGHSLATQAPHSNLREGAIGNDSTLHAKGVRIDLITGGNLVRVVRKRPHHAEGIAFISDRDFTVPKNLVDSTTGVRTCPFLAATDGRLTSSRAPSVILASLPRSLIVKGRLAPAMRNKIKGRKPGDCRSIEASCFHLEAIGSTLGMTPRGLSEPRGGVVSGP